MHTNQVLTRTKLQNYNHYLQEGKGTLFDHWHFHGQYTFQR